jgi:hypothetical protein
VSFCAGSSPSGLATGKVQHGVSDRNERRNITIGQKAMGYAMLCPNPEKGGRGKKLSQNRESLGVAKKT